MLVKKQGVDIVGAIDIGDKIGKSMYDVASFVADKIACIESVK